MKRRMTLGLAALLVAVTLGGAAEKAATLDELTGVVRTKGVKDLSPGRLEIDGGQAVGLRGAGLGEMPDGSRVWVRGRLRTLLHDNRRDPRPAMNPLQWHLYMDAAEWKPIKAPFEKPEG